MGLYRRHLLARGTHRPRSASLGLDGYDRGEPLARWHRLAALGPTRGLALDALAVSVIPTGMVSPMRPAGRDVEPDGVGAIVVVRSPRSAGRSQIGWIAMDAFGPLERERGQECMGATMDKSHL